jgi:hypothetical protein
MTKKEEQVKEGDYVVLEDNSTVFGPIGIDEGSIGKIKNVYYHDSNQPGDAGQKANIHWLSGNKKGSTSELHANRLKVITKQDAEERIERDVPERQKEETGEAAHVKPLGQELIKNQELKTILDELKKNEKVKIYAIIQETVQNEGWSYSNDVIVIPKSSLFKPKTLKDYFSIKKESYDDDFDRKDSHEVITFDETIGTETTTEVTIFNSNLFVDKKPITRVWKKDIWIRTWVRYYLHEKDAFEKATELSYGYFGNREIKDIYVQPELRKKIIKGIIDKKRS